jgi:bifunctional non-homologous end joining protein LigD
MLATLIDAPFDSKDWVFETKWDGFRLVAKIEDRSVTLYSRGGLIVSDNYKPIAKALEKTKKDAVIDGELVALDGRGVSRFQLLQNALNTTAHLHYCVFDVMFVDGEDLRGQPLVERKKRLKALLPKDPLLIYSEHWSEHGKRLFREAEHQGLEGVMAKRADSRYLSGARSKDWLKIKVGKRQEAVIVGFTAPKRTRPRFGALVLAVRERKDWRYVGHVGTGFSHAVLEELHANMLSLRTAKSPFKQRIKDEAVTTWIKPKLVAEVKFTEWTSGGEMRHPAV